MEKEEKSPTPPAEADGHPKNGEGPALLCKAGGGAVGLFFTPD